MIGTRLGTYEVVALVDAGGMGEVYRARDTRLVRGVAIKVLPADFAADPERRRRFEEKMHRGQHGRGSGREVFANRQGRTR
jgi:serine/threonine protein kinase